MDIAKLLQTKEQKEDEGGTIYGFRN